jgi:hypothetical protein
VGVFFEGCGVGRQGMLDLTEFLVLFDKGSVFCLARGKGRWGEREGGGCESQL